jgi:hypothetical protein
VPPEVPLGIDETAARFAARHGSFALHFDATGNPASPDYRPWTLELDGDRGAWGGFTAEEALDFAGSELAGQARD